MLIELQPIPIGQYYPGDSEAEVWMPQPHGRRPPPAESLTSTEAFATDPDGRNQLS